MIPLAYHQAGRGGGHATEPAAPRAWQAAAASRPRRLPPHVGTATASAGGGGNALPAAWRPPRCRPKSARQGTVRGTPDGDSSLHCGNVGSTRAALTAAPDVGDNHRSGRAIAAAAAPGAATSRGPGAPAPSLPPPTTGASRAVVRRPVAAVPTPTATGALGAERGGRRGPPPAAPPSLAGDGGGGGGRTSAYAAPPRRRASTTRVSMDPGTCTSPPRAGSAVGQSPTVADDAEASS